MVAEPDAVPDQAISLMTTCEVLIGGVGVGATEGVAMDDCVGVGVGEGVGVEVGDRVGVGFGVTDGRGVTEAVGDMEGVTSEDMRGVMDTTGVGATMVPAGAKVLAPSAKLVPDLVPRFGTSVAPGAKLGDTSVPMSATVLSPRSGKMAPTFATTK